MGEGSEKSLPCLFFAYPIDLTFGKKARIGTANLASLDFILYLCTRKRVNTRVMMKARYEKRVSILLQG